MANRVKDTVEFFPFYVKDGRTLYVMQKKYGLSGVGFFTQVMRWLGKTPGHYYAYVEDFDKDRFNEFVGMSESDVRAYMNDMVRTGKVDQELWEERNVIFSQDFLDALEELYRKRKTDIPTKESVIDETASYCRHIAGILPEYEIKSSAISEQSRVEESIVDKSKVEDTSTPAASSSDEAETELYHTIKNAFLSQQPGNTFKNWGKEGKAIKQLITDAKARSPSDPAGYLHGMMTTFQHLRESDKFFGGQPFTPSALNSAGIYDRVLNHAKQEWERAKQWEDATA